MTTPPKLLVTGASGQLGGKVIDALLARVPADRVTALVRRPEAAAPLSAKGVTVREADYDDPASLKLAFARVDRLLLISGNDLEARQGQHRNVIEAARAAGVPFIAYTSLLHAAESPMRLGVDHRATEEMIRDSGLSHAFLRNGWYTENYAASIQPALENGALVGAAGEGRIASAARADYAEAAAAVMTSESPEGIYELAGDDSYDLAEFAAEIAEQARKDLPYVDMKEDEYAAVLSRVGLPEPMAQVLANCDACAAKGWLFDDSRTLSRLIGRPTTPWRDTIAAQLAG